MDAPHVSAPNLRDAELRFHPAEEMRVCALLGPEQPVAARTFHRRREGGHQRALRDELREEINRSLEVEYHEGVKPHVEPGVEQQ